MDLATGVCLGPYEIESPIGAGGMGVVYRAHDRRLGRDVAIKVLASGFSADPDRLQRFELEARSAAALNHPNILAVYDIGEHEGAPYIVSELLEGETLRERIRVGAVPVRKAVEYAVEIARGLAAAHEKGIIHRDLKPENLFVTSDGRVKILDFGLAKLTQTEPLPELSYVATTVFNTTPGVVLGTVSYMSPEQVRGIRVDHRADLFAFGAVLYEVLSGRRPFSRDTPAETMAAILNEDLPDLGAGAFTVPPALVRIVNRCVEKNPAARFQTASDLAFALTSVSDTSSAAYSGRVDTPWRRRAWTGWVAAAVAVVTLVPVAYFRDRPGAPARPMRFEIPPTVDFAGPGNFGLSPDGRRLVFVGQGADGIPRLWLRTMDSLNVTPLPGSEAVPVTPPPFWSPDGRFVAFDSGSKLKKLDVAGGLPQTLADLPGVAVGGSWSRRGDIIVGNTAGGVLRIRETGGPLSAATMVDPSQKEEAHLFPSFLPDGQHFIYLRLVPGAPEVSGVYVGSLDVKPEEQSARRLLPYVVGPTYVPSLTTGSGWLLYLREGTLMAQAFEADRLELAGNPIAVAEKVGSFRDGGFFSASTNDVLVYRIAYADSQLMWHDRQGNAAGAASEPGPFRSVALSPDGTRAVVSRTNQQDATKADLWLLDLSRGSAATRLTFGNGLAEYPIWSRDGQRIAFTFDNNTIRQTLGSAEGEPQELLRTSSVNLIVANDWSPDGRFFLYSGYTMSSAGVGNLDLGLLPSTGDRKPVPFAQTGLNEQQGRVAPNGRWIAYVSNQSGTNEIYVRQVAQDFAGGSTSVGGSTLVSRGGGISPRWRGDGRELFYVAPTGKIMAVDVTGDQDLHAGTPTALFQMSAGTILGDVTADGKRFLLMTPAGSSASVPFTAVLNWTTDLKQ